MSNVKNKDAPAMRADAQKNRQRLIEVTIELILEVGGEPSRDARRTAVFNPLKLKSRSPEFSMGRGRR